LAFILIYFVILVHKLDVEAFVTVSEV